MYPLVCVVGLYVSVGLCCRTMYLLVCVVGLYVSVGLCCRTVCIRWSVL